MSTALTALVSVAALALGMSATGALAAPAKAIVLVHGAFADGSGWQGVYKILKADGYDVSIVQEPNLSLEGDVAATKLIIAQQTKPVVLVGHSYGGAVITEAGNEPQGFRARLHSGVGAGQRRIGRLFAPDVAIGRGTAANPAAPGWLPDRRPCEIPRGVCR
jgi:pimeloyl-ACP methyl ester carboxylesterase